MSASERVVIQLQCIRARLWIFYRKYRAENPGRNLTELADFTVKMAGSKDGSKKLKLKGAECWGFLLFIVDELHSLRERTGALGRQLLAAGTLLVRWRELLDKTGTNVPTAVLEERLGQRVV